MCRPCVQTSPRVCTIVSRRRTLSSADVEARKRLRSASSSASIVSRTRLSIVGDRAFPVAAARVWNSLPHHVTSALRRLLSGRVSRRISSPFPTRAPDYVQCRAVTPVILDTLVVHVYVHDHQASASSGTKCVIILTNKRPYHLQTW